MQKGEKRLNRQVHNFFSSGLLRYRSQWRCIIGNEWNKRDDPVFWNKFGNIWITSLPARNDAVSVRMSETSVQSSFLE